MPKLSLLIAYRPDPKGRPMVLGEASEHGLLVAAARAAIREAEATILTHDPVIDFVRNEDAERTRSILHHLVPEIANDTPAERLM